MRATWLGLVLLAAAGCGGGPRASTAAAAPADPAASPLAPGAEVVMAKASGTDPGGDSVVIFTGKPVGEAGLDFVVVKLGSKATVVEDPSGPGAGRPIKVNVATPETGQVVGTVERWQVRPAPR